MQHYSQIPFAGPSSLVNVNGNASIAPQDTTLQPAQLAPQQLQPSQTSQPTGLVAKGDWTKDLVQLAKTAELKKHALTLQLHTAHILSAYACLEQKSKAIQDLLEQKNKLDGERNRLLNALREVNADRDKADMMEVSMEKECQDLRLKITQLTEGEYATAKEDVDRLRQELGQPPLPSLQSTLDDKASQYLINRRLGGDSTSTTTGKRPSVTAVTDEGTPVKRPRGRPKGSRNRGGKSANGL